VEAGPDCVVALQLEGGKVWFTDSGSARAKKGNDGALNRTVVEAGDRLIIRCGDSNTEILFAECRSASGARLD
jgi:hypothetical protein